MHLSRSGPFVLPIRARGAVLAMLVSILGAAVCVAHPGHGKPVARGEAVKRATEQVDKLVTDGKIEKSWQKAAKLQSAELRGQAGQTKEWAVIFTNATAADASKGTLYVFLSESGDYLAANFTGN